MFSVAGPDIQVYNSYFLSNENQDFDLYFGDGAIVSGNHFVLNNWTGNVVEDSQNVIFENNLPTPPRQLAKALAELQEAAASASVAATMQEDHLRLLVTSTLAITILVTRVRIVRRLSSTTEMADPTTVQFRQAPRIR
jgi:hypothetical protein